MQPIPAFRYKSSTQKQFLQALKRASVGRCFTAAKISFLVSGLSAQIGASQSVSQKTLPP